MRHFEFTVTASPKKQVFNDIRYPIKYGKMRPLEQWNLLRDLIVNILQGYHFKCIPELHKNGNVHVHGHCILPEGATKLDIEDIRKQLDQIGRSSFTMISDLNSWLNYIHKDQSEMNNLSFSSGFYQMQIDFLFASGYSRDITISNVPS